MRPQTTQPDRMARQPQAGWHGHAVAWPCKPPRVEHGHATAWPCHPAYRRGGFTLVEILATLVLVAIILPVAMSGISLALGVADQSRRQTEAASLAQTKMAEIIAAQQWQTASLAGDFAPDWPEYRWAAQVSDWQGTTVRQLDVEVLWNHGGTDQGVTLSTLVYTGSSGTTGTSQ